jgi:hypothetical protein
MFRRKCLQIALLICTGVLTARNSAHAQDTVIAGLKGKVQTILTERFTSKDLAGREPSGTTLDVYDPAGYVLESFRYRPDGSLWEQVVYYRNGPQVFRVDVTGTSPYEPHSEENIYDAEGRVVESDIYDANAVLVSKTTNVFAQQGPNSDIMYQRIETIKGATATTVTTKIAETTDPQTGITHQVTTKNEQIDLDWVIQRSPDATVKKDKAVQPDGSYTERERNPDGTTLQDQYNAAAKMHNYMKLDAKGHIVESIEKSSSYYIRCTYSFDEAGRQTGQINYGISGNILDKSNSEYRDDSHGNWIEQKTIVWNTKIQPMQPKIVKLTLRTINYY